ncbi:MAG: TIGR03619 family F420-dependent LLM class oxidoreductase [Mycobacterium sp.]
MSHPELSVYLTTYTDGPHHDWPATLALAQAMDEARVDRLVVSDHVAFGEDFAAYGDPALGGTAGGRQPTGPDGAWLEPIAVLTAIAATTTRIRLGTSILLAALRRPAVLAKQLATLDVISAGRLDVGVGVGWQREEYEACGLPFEGRGRLLDHTLEVCTTLWTQHRASYEGPEFSFDGIHQMPKPVQSDGVPLWISGTVNRAVVRRLARFGSGWIPWGADLADLRGSIPAMKQALRDAGSDPSSLKVQGAVRARRDDDGGVDYRATVAAVPDLVAAGVTDFRVAMPLPPERDRATEVLAQLVEAFRAVTR